jgi:hypothetical protein
MEARFDHDFSRVRIHADEAAASSAESVAARAYTVGSHVVFGANRYAPGTAAGTELLAHELTHVVQQRDAGDVPAVLPVAPADDALERAAATASTDGARVQRQDEGDTRFRRRDIRSEHAPTRTGQVWTGTIDRVEVQETFRRHPAEPPHTDQMADMSGGFHPVTVPGRPAREGWESTVTPRGAVTLEYDEGACELRIPTRLVFHNPGPGQLPTADPCNTHSAAPTAPLPADVFAQLRTAFRDTVNERLNNWYRLNFTGCEAGAPCVGGATIRVVATDATDGGGGTGPQVDVWLINAGGRSCAQPSTTPEAAYIYAPGGRRDQAMWGHEGGHFALHYGDEYSEEGYPSGRVEETDYSGFASQEMSSLGVLHTRHFSFAPEFVNHVMETSGRSCRASLRETARPTVLLVGENLSFGGFSSPTGGGMYLDLGMEFGVPLDRMRTWQTVLGAHARLLGQLDSENQNALLGGIRVGIEGNIPLSRQGYVLGTGAYAEGGAGVFDLGRRDEVHPYGEVGAYARLRFLQTGDVMPFIGVEGALGGRLDMPGQIGPVTEPSRDAGPTEWMRFGIFLGVQH